jgi:uncharacterized ferritin-like protein (DUF455 family)
VGVRPGRCAIVAVCHTADESSSRQLTSIDLAWDIIARFAASEINGAVIPDEFYLDWVKVRLRPGVLCGPCFG